MKKLSVILASLVLFAGVSFAAPVKKQVDKSKAKTEKKAPAKQKKAASKPAASKEKAPAAK